jgi:probable phosphoglycerate mutase
MALPSIYIARHGETEWSASGQHTSRTDIPLTKRGEENGRRLGQRLRGLKFERVYTSPLQRAARTCELAGFKAQATIDPELVEWDYGEYEGKTTAEINRTRPDWLIWRDGCPQGESPAAVSNRADRLLARLRPGAGDVLVFSSGHILRAIGTRWLGLEIAAGRYFYLGTASLSILGYEHERREEPVFRLWNDMQAAQT